MSNFSLQGYRELLSAFRDAGYFFCKFEEIDQCLTKEKPFVVLRHDIDISLNSALEIAHLEHEQGVRSIYFITFHSPFYNALSYTSKKSLQQIYQLGHQIALHADTTVHEGDFDRALSEIGVLSQFYPYVNTETASLHSPINLEYMPLEAFEPLQRVYGHILSKKMAYISDSTGRWRYGHPLDSEAFYLQKPIQLLTHPIWWTQEDEHSLAKLKNCLYQHYLNNLKDAEEFLPKLFTSINIGEKAFR